MIKIGVDAMGGDFAPKEQILGAMMAIKKIKDIDASLLEGEVKRISGSYNMYASWYDEGKEG